VRNSGVEAVVEGVGDHACEYMTGGRVVVLGQTGRNFGAGMSGGIAYVLDEVGDFAIHFNDEMADRGPVEDPEDITELKALIERHIKHTKSGRGQQVLDEWDAMLPKFVKVMPRDYRKMLNAFKRAEESGLTGDEAALFAFHEAMAEAS
jgi:glutamate synthase (ferredoxin)